MKTIHKSSYAFHVAEDEPLYHGEPFWDVVQDNRWENKTFELIERFCRADKAFIDIGAWIGPTTLFGACIAKHVYAVEPDPVAAETLRSNIHLNANLSAKITLFEGCISDNTGTVEIGNPNPLGDSQTSILFAETANRQTVQSLTFPDFISRYAIEHCSMVKMDVEGAEVFILPTMSQVLQRLNPTLLISLHKPHYGERSEEILGLIHQLLSRLYAHVYDVQGNPITDMTRIEEPFFDLIATNESW